MLSPGLKKETTMEINSEIVITLAAIVLMVGLLVADYLRPGLVLFSVVVLFMVVGILTPKEVLAGFSNKGMITVALLFLVSEGVRKSDALGFVIKKLLPDRPGVTVRQGYARLLPTIMSISAFLNNTPIVVVFIPIIKQWAKKVGLPIKKFLIPLSYAAILGGICTLIGTSTNLVVHGMMLDAGFRGFSMFELGKVGVVVAICGGLYLYFFGSRRLPDDDPLPEEEIAQEESHIVEAVIGPRFPGINRRYDDFNFKDHYGAEIQEVWRRGIMQKNVKQLTFREGDMLVLNTDGNFITTWGDSTVFLALNNGKAHETACPRWKRWLALGLLTVMIAGATFESHPVMQNLIPGVQMDMFFWVCVVTIIMACFDLFPAKKYTKFISWDVLITIACAFGISQAMTNSGMADFVANRLIALSGDVSPIAVLAVLYIVTNIITELITNNAAAAFAFPIALATATQLGVDPMPFFVTICIAASASFSSPIGYQTNLIVQGIGNYRFKDFVRIGLPLNILMFVITITLVPIFWKF